MVYVRGLPACTGFGEAVLVTTMFAVPAAPTPVNTLALLFARFGSVVPEVTLSVSRICVPLTAAAFTFTCTLKVATAAPLATNGLVQVMFPDAPTAGVVQAQPAAGVIEKKVVLAGTASLKTALTAASGPLLVTVWV